VSDLPRVRIALARAPTETDQTARPRASTNSVPMIPGTMTTTSWTTVGSIEGMGLSLLVGPFPARVVPPVTALECMSRAFRHGEERIVAPVLTLSRSWRDARSGCEEPAPEVELAVARMLGWPLGEAGFFRVPSGTGKTLAPEGIAKAPDLIQIVSGHRYANLEIAYLGQRKE
jgi:hypothetical protein